MPKLFLWSKKNKPWRIGKKKTRLSQTIPTVYPKITLVLESDYVFVKIAIWKHGRYKTFLHNHSTAIGINLPCKVAIRMAAVMDKQNWSTL